MMKWRTLIVCHQHEKYRDGDLQATPVRQVARQQTIDLGLCAIVRKVGHAIAGSQMAVSFYYCCHAGLKGNLGRSLI